jgi:hypothetical protein
MVTVEKDSIKGYLQGIFSIRNNTPAARFTGSLIPVFLFLNVTFKPDLTFLLIKSQVLPKEVYSLFLVYLFLTS